MRQDGRDPIGEVEQVREVRERHLFGPHLRGEQGGGRRARTLEQRQVVREVHHLARGVVLHLVRRVFPVDLVRPLDGLR
ncbi:hypothetical protein D3C86_1639700 [compost metagenome]